MRVGIGEEAMFGLLGGGIEGLADLISYYRREKMIGVY